MFEKEFIHVINKELDFLFSEVVFRNCDLKREGNQYMICLTDSDDDFYVLIKTRGQLADTNHQRVMAAHLQIDVENSNDVFLTVANDIKILLADDAQIEIEAGSVLDGTPRKWTLNVRL